MLYSMKNYKLDICFNVTHFEDHMQVHAPDEGSKVSHNQAMYMMSTLENHSFENESEINYIVK